MTGTPDGAGRRQVSISSLKLGAQTLRYVHGFGCEATLSEILLKETADRSSILFLIDQSIGAHAKRMAVGLANGIPITIISIAPRELNKTLTMIEGILERAVLAGIDRRSVVVAMGGGLTGNIAGMAAALLYRGLPLIHLPTTPVAAFDAALSAKQAVNLRYGKNLCGTFLTPSLIACDLAWLQSVPRSQMMAGAAEMAKNVLAVVPEEADRLRAVLAADCLGSEASLTALLEIGIAAKAPFLATDALERKGALIFEYGHTVGHALEFASQDTMSHGEAVAWGMLAAADVARQLCGLADDAWEQHHAIVSALGLSRVGLRAVDAQAVKALLASDNKRGYLRGGRDSLAMVLLESLGKPVTNDGLPLVDVPRALVDSAVDALLGDRA